MPDSRSILGRKRKPPRATAPGARNGRAAGGQRTASAVSPSSPSGSSANKAIASASSLVGAQTNTAVTAGYACVLDTSWGADHITTTNGLRGLLVGVAQVDIAALSYGWFQRSGKASVGVRVLASAAADARLNTTATAGALDDDGTATTKEILGIALTTANGGSTALTAAMLNFPAVGVTL